MGECVVGSIQGIPSNSIVLPYLYCRRNMLDTAIIGYYRSLTNLENGPNSSENRIAVLCSMLAEYSIFENTSAWGQVGRC